ncbi:FecCD family ABC transporter permease [Plantibacter sp. Mn2098]|uniref:FecCD family ABC transporter permease n=1 Tax=Plantibacter sp. Mn2098 TaxID=3395266 RepID=UPI003BDEA67D
MTVSRRRAVVIGALAVLIMVLAVVALGSGDYPLSPAETLQAFLGDGFAHRVVTEWRAPRVAAWILFGAALGVSGSVFQSITRNPLGSPDVIGLGAGSYTGALVAMLVFGAGRTATTLGALVGGVAAAIIVFALAAGRRGSGLRLILTGVAVAGMLTSVNTWLLLTARVEVAQAASVWGMGTLTGMRWDLLGAPAVAILAGVVLVGVCAGPTRTLELGDDLATALGIRPTRVRWSIGLAGVILTAAVVSAAGPIAFVALVAPHLARLLTGAPGFRPVAAGLCGAVVLGAADVVAQRLIAPAQLPVGVVTVCVGGVFLLVLLLTRSR